MNSDKMADYKEAIDHLAAALIALRSDPARLLFICPHDRADGDALGAGFALNRVLEKLGIRSLLLLSEEVSKNFAYLGFGDEVKVLRSEERSSEFLEAVREKHKPAVMMVDCSGTDRLGVRRPLFETLPEEDRFVLDHHLSSMELSRRVLIRPEAAATCELAADLITAWEDMEGRELLDQKTATALYTGMLTDTGRFTYRATSSNTLFAAGRMLDYDVDTQFLSSHLFDMQTLGSIRLRCRLAEDLDFFEDGRGVIAKVTAAIMEECGASREDLEVIPSWLRDIENVEVSIVVRDLDEGSVRGNLRSLPPLKVEPVARIFGGGGHAQASGFTVEDGDLDEVYRRVREEAAKLLQSGSAER